MGAANCATSWRHSQSGDRRDRVIARDRKPQMLMDLVDRVDGVDTRTEWFREQLVRATKILD